MQKMTKNEIIANLEKYENKKEKLEVVARIKRQHQYLITNRKYVNPQLSDAEVSVIEANIAELSKVQAEFSTSGNKLVRANERADNFRTGEIWDF